MSPEFYIYRRRSLNEVLPWDIIDAGIDKQFLIRELKKAKKGIVTPDCRVNNCHACGIKKIVDGGFCESKNEI